MPTTVDIVTITGDLGGSDMVLLGRNFFYAMVYPQKPQRLDIHTRPGTAHLEFGLHWRNDYGFIAKERGICFWLNGAMRV